MTKQKGLYTRADSPWLWFSIYTAEIDSKTGRRKRVGICSETKDAEKAERKRKAVQKEMDALWEAKGGKDGPLTVRKWAEEKWLPERERRKVLTWKDDRDRLLHLYPYFGEAELVAVSANDMRRAFRDIMATKMSQPGEPKETAKDKLAPKTVLNIYATVRVLFRDAILEELRTDTPCVLRVDRKELPRKRDKYILWRKSAVFTREEIEALISDTRIRFWRRAVYGFLFLSGTRSGESMGRYFSNLDTSTKPLWSLIIDTAWNAKRHALGLTKTEVPRVIPVHPTLRRLLAEWKLSGFHERYGRHPKPEDYLFPSLQSGRGKTEKPEATSTAYIYDCLQEDLKRLGLRPRRVHDSRRAFITLARAAGARSDIIKWITHDDAQEDDIADLYTSWPFETLCEEVCKLDIQLAETRVPQTPAISQT